MSNQILSMNKLHLILRLLIDGRSQRSIGRAAEISKGSVAKYAAIFASHEFSLSELLALSEFDLQQIVKPNFKQKSSLALLYESFPKAIKELKKVGVTKQYLWDIYKEEHSDGVAYS